MEIQRSPSWFRPFLLLQRRPGWFTGEEREGGPLRTLQLRGPGRGETPGSSPKLVGLGELRFWVPGSSHVQRAPAAPGLPGSGSQAVVPSAGEGPVEAEPPVEVESPVPTLHALAWAALRQAPARWRRRPGREVRFRTDHSLASLVGSFFG